MKFHNAGKFNGDMSSLPQREHAEGMVPFKEPEDPKKLSIIANVGAVLTFLLFGIPVFLVERSQPNVWHWTSTLGWFFPIITIVPHEILHALCFKEDVYMYNDLKQGLMFVVGTEDMTKARFIMMSLLPNLVFGLVPYILFYFFPQIAGLGIFGTICIGMGFGDYMNVYNAMTQMPNGALTYNCGFNTFWYMPKGGE